MIKTKKQSLIVIGAFALVMLLGTVTYAFFNYTRTGSSNNIRVGRISFESKNEETITLNNLFPIDSENTTDMNDSTKVGTYSIDIKGDTDYVDGIEYLVSAVDTNIYTNQGQIVPISLDITVDDLGTPNANYFTARESKNANIYKKLVGGTLVGDQMLLVGYIKPNTTSGTAEGIDGSITIKAYLDKNKIAITDTPEENVEWQEERTIISTSEWNALQSTGLSFKVKVEANEGIWVNSSLEEIMKQENYDTIKNRGILDNEQSEFVSALTGINFGEASSDTNGKGVYMRAGTENDDYPILYYRGAVEDNNVVFNNKCWKAVRTTDTGGVKLIYNGVISPVYETIALEEEGYEVVNNTASNDAYIYTFDETENKWKANTNLKNTNFSFKVTSDGYYTMLLELNWDSAAAFSIKVDDDYIVPTSYNHPNYSTEIVIGNLTTDNVISFDTTAYYGGQTLPTYSLIGIKILRRDDLITESGCDNTGTDAHINILGTNTFLFNLSDNSPAYVGYMYGDVYESIDSASTFGAYYGTGFTWDGTSYTLTSAKVGYDGTHHYTCNLTTAEGTCNSIRYYYYVSGTRYNYYVTLTGGDSIEKAIEKMQTNTNDSNAKTQIDTWYAENMSTVTSKLEDTIWCNDRSISSKAGWDPNGNVTANTLYYSPYDRAYNTNVPSLSCANKNDAFTVSNGNGNQKLTYPVALLTSDEMTLAGGKIYSNLSFYLNNGADYWSLSPSYFSINNASEFIVYRDGALSIYDIARTAIGLRPAISIKPGLPVVSGTGTVADPYVIE